MRIAGQEQFNAAKAGEGDGFAAPEFIQASQKLAELGAMEPCQDGWLGATWPETTPVFNDGRAAMILGFQNQATPSNQANNSTDGVGLSQDVIGRFPFPEVPGGKGLATDDFGGLNGWVITKAAPPETEDFLKFFTSVETMTTLAQKTGILPTTLGAEVGVTDPDIARQRRADGSRHLAPELRGPGPRPQRRPRGQRHGRRCNVGRSLSGGCVSADPGHALDGDVVQLTVAGPLARRPLLCR